MLNQCELIDIFLNVLSDFVLLPLANVAERELSFAYHMTESVVSVQSSE